MSENIENQRYINKIIYFSFSVPLELPIITREHFNRWYSLRAYYIAMTVADIPIQALCTVTYIVITYYMTAQPPEPYRMGLFTLICLMVAWVAQGLGLLVASLFNVKVRSFFFIFQHSRFKSHLFCRMAPSSGRFSSVRS